MDEDPSERRQQIIEAAFREFARKGFRGATIKSIARTAGLQSPSLIYWYFDTKEALFQATIEERLPLLQAALNPKELMEQPPETLLPALAQRHMKVVDQPEVLQMSRLFLSEMGKRPQLADLLSETFIEPVLQFMKTYLAHQIELGRLREHDVRAGARAFVGMLLPQLFSFFFFPRLRADDLSNESHLETVIEIFLNGLRPGKAPKEG